MPPFCPTVIFLTGFLPDKAIDLVDEACALIKTEMDSMPAELDELRRKVMQMEIEEAALKKEDDTPEQGASGSTSEGACGVKVRVQQPQGAVG